MGNENKIKSLLWNKYQNAPNPIGIFALSWLIAVVAGIAIMVTQGQDIAMEKTKYIGMVGAGASFLSFAYIEIKKIITKKRSQ